MAGSRPGLLRFPSGLTGAGARASRIDVNLAAFGRRCDRTSTLRRSRMSSRHMCAGLSGLAFMLIPLGESAAHEIVGNRFFPATLGIDDPGVNDELALPTISSFKTGDDPSFRQLDFSGEFSKRITDAFAIAVGSTYSRLSPPGGPTGTGANGFQTRDTTFKYRVLKDPAHEFVMSVGLSIEWGGTG